MTQRPRRAVASAPGSIGNIGPGLDVLGCALSGGLDSVSVEWSVGEGVTLEESGHPDLPTEARRHTAGIAVWAVLTRARERGAGGGRGLAIRTTKGLALASGQGGSAASAAAGAVAANALLGRPLSTEELLACCLEAEATVAGRHLDNIAPALLGGIVLVRRIDPVDVVRLPVPRGLCVALATPEQRLSTAAARDALPRQVPLAAVVHQIAHACAMVAACYTGDVERFGRLIDDRIAEPARAPLIPGFAAVKRAALAAGGYGVSISGGGPTVFAIASEAVVSSVARAMAEAFTAAGIAATSRVATIEGRGALERCEVET